MTKLTVAFRNFGNAPKNPNSYSWHFMDKLGYKNFNKPEEPQQEKESSSYARTVKCRTATDVDGLFAKR